MGRTGRMGKAEEKRFNSWLPHFLALQLGQDAPLFWPPFPYLEVTTGHISQGDLGD